MAMTITLANLLTKVRNRVEIYADYVPDAELTTMVNDSVAELYRQIVRVNPEWYMSTTASSINVVSGTSQYSLPSDFFMALGVDVKDTNSNWLNLRPFTWGERNMLQDTQVDRIWTRYRIVGEKLILVPTPSWTATAGIRLWYVPTPPVLSGSVSLDTFAGFDEWVVNDVGVKFCAKEESDPTIFAAERDRAWAWIEGIINKRDAAEPDRVRDVLLEHSGENFAPSYYRP